MQTTRDAELTGAARRSEQRGHARVVFSRSLSICVVAIVVALWALTLLAQTRSRDFVPISDATLANPDPSDWINWRRTLDGWGYSPLRQITRENVGNLQLVWSWSMQSGENQPTPLVYSGVMYLAVPGGVQALDAATGEFIWEYERKGVAKRNIALYDDKVIVHTRDNHIIALDASSGKVAWDTAVPDPEKKGFGFSSGGIVAKGKIISGMTGCGTFRADTCYILGHDAKTGRELWRTSTVARPDEPGGETWGDLQLAFRAGSEPWMPGSYDPATNLVYWGTAQAKPWTQEQRGTGDDELLYTNSTLALDPDSGKIVWYFQHIPGESHDMDEVFENILVDTGSRKSLFKMGKIAVLWELDRVSGKFLNAYDLGYQNLLDIDKKTGAVKYRPGVLPQNRQPVEYCSGAGGFKNLWAMSFHPDTRAFYIPIKLSCAVGTFQPVERVIGGGGNGGWQRVSRPHPQSPDNLGEFLAMDSQTGKVLWRHRQPLPFDTAALTTGGGLAFIGDLDRFFSAFDVASGKVLWRTRLPMPAEGFPVTYSVRGRQYLAVTSGPGPLFVWINVTDLRPDFHRVPGGMSIHVYALPEASTKSQ